VRVEVHQAQVCMRAVCLWVVSGRGWRVEGGEKGSTVCVERMLLLQLLLLLLSPCLGAAGQGGAAAAAAAAAATTAAADQLTLQVNYTVSAGTAVAQAANSGVARSPAV